MFFIEEMGLVSHVPITAATSSSVLSVHWQPTHALPSTMILFLQDGSDNKVCSALGSVIKPYLVPDQCSLFCLLLKLHFWLVLGVGLPILCVCMGGLCAAAGVRPWVTGDRACAVWLVGHVRVCIGVLSSSCLPSSPQFHFKQHTFPKGKDGRWHFESKPLFLVPVSKMPCPKQPVVHSLGSLLRRQEATVLILALAEGMNLIAELWIPPFQRNDGVFFSVFLIFFFF